MKEIGLLMRPHLVESVLSGVKTETRRPLDPQPGADWTYLGEDCGDFVFCDHGHLDFGKCPGDQRLHYRRIMAGARLWVREVHWRHGRWVRNGTAAGGRTKWRFKATSNRGAMYCGPHDEQLEPVAKKTAVGWHKRPSLFMLKAMSRLTLEVLTVRCERLQEITPQEVMAEGIGLDHELYPNSDTDHKLLTAFEATWDKINSEHAGRRWQDNPWVAVIQFRKL